MFGLFLTSALGFLTTIPLHFIGLSRNWKLFGFLSSVPFVFWFGIIFAPQERFLFFSYWLHWLIGLPLLLIACWLGFLGVKAVGLKQAVFHSRPKKIITKGVYGIVRHPQHLASFLAHLGAVFLFSAWYALLYTPVVIFTVYLLSIIEEKEILKEFEKDYRDYQKTTPMLMPRLK